MKTKFKKVGILGRIRDDKIIETLNRLLQALSNWGQAFLVDETLKPMLQGTNWECALRDTLAKQCDLFIVVGGDGSLLQAARLASVHQIPVVGINKGRLGFLTDIRPEQIDTVLRAVLEGKYLEEERFLIEAEVQQDNKIAYKNISLNDVVLLPGDVAHMIEFEIYINQQFVCKQRADGLIVTTPTGSTAYALSGGGPILDPTLDAIALVPMFPHTLSSRPLVVPSDAQFDIKIPLSNETSPWLSCDGQEKVLVTPGSQIHIQKRADRLQLIHPQHYNYYETLRSKLHWGGVNGEV